MSRFFDNQVISNVAAANDIVDVLSSYIQLKRDGKNYSALCPFHKEKTPSFKVFPDSQRFKCFGCGKGGNVFTFVQEIEKLTFPESVELLARRVGIQLSSSPAERSQLSKRNMIFELNSLASSFFSSNLISDCGSIAREYLTARGFKREFFVHHGLGYSKKEWSGLLNFLGSKGISPNKLVDAGLAVENENGRTYDRFRNRLMFPIHDLHGKVAGFGARTLGDDHPKYLNTSDTPVFNKSGLLYGLYNARDAISASRSVIVMEGYTDVLAAVQNGFENTCATLGTALTVGHLKLIKRYADKVILVYDGDEAGIKAAERSLPLFISEEVPVQIVVLPSGSDPYDYLKKNGAEAFGRKLKGSKKLFSYYLGAIADKYDFSDPNQKVKAAEALSEMASKVPDRLQREIWISEIAQFLSVNPASLSQKVHRKLMATALREKQRGGGEEDRPAQRRVILKSGFWTIIGAVLAFPVLLDKFHEEITAKLEDNEPACDILKRIISLYEQKESNWATTFWQSISDPEVFRKVERASQTAPEEIEKATEVVTLTLSRVGIPDNKDKISDLQKKIIEAEQEGDEWALNELLLELQHLQRESRKKRP